MPYEVDINRGGSSRLQQEVGLASTARSQGREGASPHYKFYELEPAIVISVDITNKDATQIGSAKVRPLYSYASVPEAQLPIAVPLDSNVKSYPLRGEVVIVVEYNNRLYYTQRLNFFNHINQNITSNLYISPQSTQGGKSEFVQVSAGNPNKTSDTAPTEAPGKYFAVNKKIQSLLPLEGDIIYEGRFGNSIRFGGTVMTGTSGVDSRFKGTWAIGDTVGAPIIIIRNGQKVGGDEKVPYVEDINKDASSIYITNGQIIPLKTATTNQKTWEGTAPSLFDGNQVLISSDRVVLNAKHGEILLFSAAPIGLATSKGLNIDTGADTIINSPNIFLGYKAAQPIILGNKTADWLKSLLTEMKNLITAINNVVVRTGTGPSDPVSAWAPNASGFNNVNSKLTELENTIDTLLSKQNFTL